MTDPVKEIHQALDILELPTLITKADLKNSIVFFQKNTILTRVVT